MKPLSVTRFALVPIAFVALWQLACTGHVVNQALVSSPIDVIREAARLSSEGVLWPDVGISVRRALLGFLIGLLIGTSLGVTAGLWRWAESVIDTPMQVLNTLPFLALVPLFILWFGIGEEPKIALIATGSSVPIYLNLVSAIRNVDVRLVEMAQTSGANRRKLVFRVLLPGALPGTLVGLRMSLAFSVIGLVAAEEINATSGIGYMMQQASNYFQTDVLFVGLAFYALFGLIAAAFVTLLERLLLSWQPRFSGR